MVKRRKFIRTVSYLLALCLAAAVAGVFSGMAKESYEKTLEKVRFEALNSLCEYTHELSGGLSLLSVSLGDAVADSASYVGARSAAAIGSAACFDGKKTVNLNRFLNAAYDLSQSFSGSDEARNAASEYSDYAEELYYHLSDLSSAVMGGKYSLSEHGSVYSAQNKPYFEDYLDYSNGKEGEIFAQAASASASYGHCSVLQGRETVPLEYAKKKAAEIAGIGEALWRTRESGQKSGFELYSLFHGDTEVEICKSGGLLCRLVNPQPCGETVYSARDALMKAEDFVKNQGFAAGELLGCGVNEFTADFHFVPKINGVVLLTAPVTVSVCLSSGKITFFDAAEYIKNYRDDIRASAVTPDVNGLFSADMTVEKAFVCLAELEGREKLCCFAVLSQKDEKFTAYIDCSDLKILKMEKIALLNQPDVVYCD